MTHHLDRTVLTLAAACILFLVLGGLVPEWLRFMVQVSLAKALVVLGVMLQMRAGLVSFGQGLYFCLGGYTAGMLGHLAGITDLFLLLLLGVAVAAVVAVVLGLLMARYREIFFAMLSLALSMILYGALVRAEALGSTDGFNVPAVTLLGIAPGTSTLRYILFGFTCVLTFGCAAGLHRYLTTIHGGLGEAIRENELRVEYLGASVRNVVHLLYVIAAALSGLGGVLVAVTVGHVDPNMAYWTTSGEFVFVALLSGLGSVIAPIVGALLLEVIRLFAFEYAPYTWQMILGGTMLLVIMFLPGGLWSLATRWRTERPS